MSSSADFRIFPVIDRPFSPSVFPSRFPVRFPVLGGT
jgi:hypothetical protein